MSTINKIKKDGISYDIEDKTAREELVNKANKNEIPVVPTKVSELENDSNFINEIPFIPTKVSELENDSRFITEYIEEDPTVPNHVKQITEENITNWNNKQEPLTAGENISIEGNVISASGGGEKIINEYIWDGKQVDSSSVDYPMFQEILTKIINGEDVIVYIRVTIDDYRKNLLVPMICQGYSSNMTYMRFENYIPYLLSGMEGVDIYYASFVLNFDSDKNVAIVNAVNTAIYKTMKPYDGNSNLNWGALSINNSHSYTPTNNYHPATKKYVDDSITNAITSVLEGSY